MVVVHSAVQRRRRELGRDGKVGGSVAFVGGYLVVWTAFGVMAYALFELLRSFDVEALSWSRAGRYVAAGVIAIAAVYQLTPLKDVQIGLGETIRENKWGRDRKYVVAFRSAGSPQQPLVEFVAADDYEQTRELVAVIRGSDGARRMYGVGDALPAVYTERFRTQLYNERVVHPGAWNKLVVVAREDDDEAILNHALIQSRRRYRT